MASMNRVAMAERGSIIASLQKSKMVDDDSSNLYPAVGAKQGEPVGVNTTGSHLQLWNKLQKYQDTQLPRLIQAELQKCLPWLVQAELLLRRRET